MIFKKSQLQGGAILSNGQRVDFDSAGYFETEDETVIAQLKPIYETVTEKDTSKPAVKPAPIPTKTGMASSASLTSLTKAN